MYIDRYYIDIDIDIKLMYLSIYLSIHLSICIILCTRVVVLNAIPRVSKAQLIGLENSILYKAPTRVVVEIITRIHTWVHERKHVRRNLPMNLVRPSMSVPI
jgi:hypothetical protein